ncbi:Protein CBG25874 [Caenorhabditis briggsae]|uniref:Protein CBG25874 n=2 Tax=Caenorhabditis briggsae TaxID=6238 RepID=B6IHM9_CAEBR|nr:Protein CBG25874 [Caenorhabditis briggsae]ULU01447.1 hypothetical protein L3Y34_001649 [Caenorhabditis briggsae]CAR99385.1 Protein CBG25874 [Caenorhabditis briggsae]
MNLFHRVWNTIRQCIGGEARDNGQEYQPVDRPNLPPTRSASPNSVTDSVSINFGSSGSECSVGTWKDLEELRKGCHRPYVRNDSIENPSIASGESGYESAAI